MANPFEDPDVQAAASSNQPSNVYGGGAYDDSNQGQTGTQNIQLSDQQQQMAVQVGGQMAQQAATTVAADVKTDYEKSTAQQSDAYSAPPSPNWCTKCMMWLPIRYVAWIGGIMLMTSVIIDSLFFEPEFIYVFIGFYLFVFGVITLIVESPVFKLTRKPQLKIFFWFRLLSRMWGRAWFYIFVSILCFSDTSLIVELIVGIYLFLTAILMLFISRQAGKKYARIFEFIIGGTDPENPEEITGKLMRKFDEIDMDQDQLLGSHDLVKLAAQAGRNLSNAERHAIQTFLDESCNGAVSKEDFVKQYLAHNKRQKFL